MTGLLTILGPTASGKTLLAAQVAASVGAEIISADSRQVFKGMDIGTGKDMNDYIINGKEVPYHMVDIAEPGTEFSVYDFVTGFKEVFIEIRKQGKPAILCGGTGLYIEAVLKGYNMTEVPVDRLLRKTWEHLTNDTLTKMLKDFRPLHNRTDTETRVRLLRALEIEFYKKEHPAPPDWFDFHDTPVFGLRFERQTERERITHRLKTRLENGMADEVNQLLKMGVTPERLIHYGLEYRYVTLYVTGNLAFDEMFRQLNTAIHQFAKRQMTWFRRMERSGIVIHWLRGEDGVNKNTETILQCVV